MRYAPICDHTRERASRLCPVRVTTDAAQAAAEAIYHTLELGRVSHHSVPLLDMLTTDSHAAGTAFAARLNVVLMRLLQECLVACPVVDVLLNVRTEAGSRAPRG